MATKPASRTGGLNIKIPDTLSVKDLITVVSFAVSATIAWGVFSTRITLLEEKVISHSVVMQDQREQLRDLETKLHQQELQLRELQATSIKKK